MNNDTPALPELLPCPWCGKPPVLRGKKVGCRNEKCLARLSEVQWYTVAAWNRHPEARHEQ